VLNKPPKKYQNGEDRLNYKKVSMQVSEKVNAQKEFKVNFSGHVGRYFKEKRKDCDSPNSETFRTAADGNVVPTNRRWMQFLQGAEKITNGYIDLNGNNKGRVRISELAKKLGYEIEDCGNLIEKIHQKAAWWKLKYRTALKNAPKDNDCIDGFSIPKERLIFCKEGIDPGHKNFVIAHELSHYLLKHKGIFFYRDTGIKTRAEENGQKILSNSDISGENSIKKKKLHEKIEYSEEADKLAAILLMPYVFMRKYKDIEDDNVLAEIFQVPVRAIKKRREEIINERESICFEPSLNTEGVEP